MMDKKRWITAERWLSGVLWFIRPRVKHTNLSLAAIIILTPNRSLLPCLFVDKGTGVHKLLGPFWIPYAPSKNAHINNPPPTFPIHSCIFLVALSWVFGASFCRGDCLTGEFDGGDVVVG